MNAMDKLREAREKAIDVRRRLASMRLEGISVDDDQPKWVTDLESRMRQAGADRVFFPVRIQDGTINTLHCGEFKDMSQSAIKDALAKHREKGGDINELLALAAETDRSLDTGSLTGNINRIFGGNP